MTTEASVNHCAVDRAFAAFLIRISEPVLADAFICTLRQGAVLFERSGHQLQHTLSEKQGGFCFSNRNNKGDDKQWRDSENTAYTSRVNLLYYNSSVMLIVVLGHNSSC